MQRFDEIISDKANKYDILNIQKILKNCLNADEYLESIKKQDHINDVLNRRTKELIIHFEKHESIFINHNESFEQINKDIDELRAKSTGTVNKKELDLINELLLTKVNNYDLSEVYNMKSNKEEIQMLIGLIGQLQ